MHITAWPSMISNGRQQILCFYFLCIHCVSDMQMLCAGYICALRDGPLVFTMIMQSFKSDVHSSNFQVQIVICKSVASDSIDNIDSVTESILSMVIARVLTSAILRSIQVYLYYSE